MDDLHTQFELDQNPSTATDGTGTAGDVQPDSPKGLDFTSAPNVLQTGKSIIVGANKITLDPNKGYMGQGPGTLGWTTLVAPTSFSFQTSATTYETWFNIQGLRGDSDVAYKLYVVMDGTSNTLRLLINLNAASTNFDWKQVQSIRTASTVSVLDAINDATGPGLFIVGDASNGETCDEVNIEAFIKASKLTGSTTRSMHGHVDLPTSGSIPGMHWFAGGWQDTTHEITSIQLRGFVVGGATPLITGTYWLHKIG